MLGITTTSTGTKSPHGTQKRKKRTKEEIELEKALKESEKQARLLEKEEKKRKKDEEDRVKEEERLKKQAERDEKKAAKEQEKLLKEQEKQRKQEEQDKKDKVSLLASFPSAHAYLTAQAQLRLNSFFAAKPSAKATIRTPNPDQPTNPIESSTSMSYSNLSTMKGPTLGMIGILTSPSVLGSTTKKPTSDWESTFLPFSLKSHTRLAPVNHFFDPSQTKSTVTSIGHYIVEDFDLKAYQPSNPKTQSEANLHRAIEVLQGSSQHPIDLTSEEHRRVQAKALEEFKTVTVRYLEFYEDVRPPYCGTWSKLVPAKELSHVKRNPCVSKLTGLDYDYDSEAEWDEPEEGEDLGSDDDDESEEGDEEVMDGFIEDDVVDPLVIKRPSFVRDAPPICSGIQWEDVKGHLCSADSTTSKADFADLQMGCLLAHAPVSIDPFSTLYWSSDRLASPKKKSVIGLAGHRPALLDKTRKMNGVNPATTASGVFKVLRTIPAEDMDAFKAAIAGQDLTKLAMVEHLKKQLVNHI
jgi:chromatin assembly factor 1 subunit A